MYFKVFKYFEKIEANLIIFFSKLFFSHFLEKDL